MSKRMSALVERVLSENRVSKMSGVSPRDSDKELIIQILQYEDCQLTERQLSIIRSVNFESITRARRKLQDGGDGKYLPSPAVAKQRKFKSYMVQQNAPQASPERIQTIIDEQPKAVSWLNDED